MTSVAPQELTGTAISLMATVTWVLGKGVRSHNHVFEFKTLMVMIMIMILMKYIGVLRDTVRTPKPTSQKHAMELDTIRYHKIPYHTLQCIAIQYLYNES